MKNSWQYDKPEYFSKEMVLRVNLGPLHLFDNSVHEGLASNTDKSYVRKGSLVSQIVSKDLNKSLAIATF